MSQPRRKRRRRRGPGRAGGGRPPEAGAPQGGNQTKSSNRRRRRRRRSGGGPRAETITLEGILSSFRTPAEGPLTAEPDGQDLDEIIGELRSRWGVPPYPQEYRITIKVAEEKPDRSDRAERANGNAKSEEPRRGPTGAVREKAPAAPRVASEAADGADDETKPRKRRRRGRRRRRGGGGAGPGS